MRSAINMRRINIFFRKIIEFVKDNKIIVIILLLSVFSIIKFSELPFIKSTPDFIERFFIKPNQGATGFEVWRLLENLSLAYIASVIFYIIIDFIPKQKMERKAFNLLQSDLVSLYLYMSDIIVSIKTALGIIKDIRDISLDDVSLLDDFKLKNEPVYYYSTPYIDGEKKGAVQEFYNYYIDTPNYANLINERLEKIKKVPCAIYAEFRLLEVLSTIESNYFINQVLDFKNEPLNDDICISRCNFGKNYYDFIQSYIKLGLFKFEKHTYQKMPMSESEIKDYKDSVVDIIQTFTLEQRKSLKIYKGNQRIK